MTAPQLPEARLREMQEQYRRGAEKGFTEPTHGRCLDAIKVIDELLAAREQLACKGCGGSVGDHLAPDQGGCPANFVIDGVAMVPLSLLQSAQAQRDAARAECARVAKQRDELVKACAAKDDLLVCYRVGKQPSEALFKRLDKSKKVLDAIAAEQPKPAGGA